MGGGFTANSERSRSCSCGVGVRFGSGGVLERVLELLLLDRGGLDMRW